MSISTLKGIVSTIKAIPAERRDRERRRLYGQRRQDDATIGDVCRVEIETGDDEFNLSFEIPAKDAETIRIGQAVVVEVRLA